MHHRCQGPSQSDIPGIWRNATTNAVCHIPVSNANTWIGIAQRAARARRAKGILAPKGKPRERLHEAKGIFGVAPQHVIKKPIRRGAGRCAQFGKRRRPQPKS